MRLLFIISLLLCFSFNVKAQKPPTLILKETHSALKKRQYFCYHASCSFKFFNHDEDVLFSGDVYIKHVEKDSVFHSMLAFYTNDSIYKFYDLQLSYVVNKKKKMATIYNPANVGAWPLAGNAQYRIVGKYYLHPDELLKELDSTNVITLLNDTTIDGKLCYHISVQYPDKDGFTDYASQYFIYQQDYTVLGMKNRVQFQGNYQYYNLFLSTYSFDKIPLAKFSASQIPKDYTITKYENKQPQKKTALLDSGSMAPVIAGNNYSAGLKPDTLRYRDSVTLLDFFYMECFPCVNAIKEIEKTKEYYAGKPLRIIGINSINNNTNDIKKIPKFLSYNKVTYPIWLVDKKITDLFRVTAWPTFFIINPQGRVVYKSEGYAETLSDELNKIIDSLLK